MSHKRSDPGEVVSAVQSQYSPKGGLLTFRFEPFILAVECRQLADAQALVACAIGSGFRESGGNPESGIQNLGDE